MAAQNTDKFAKVSRKWVGQIGSGGVANGTDTTVPLASTTNLPTDTGVIVVIDRVDANGVKTPTLEETVIGVVSGSNLTSVTRGIEGTAQAHSAGAVVEVLITAKGWNNMVDGFVAEHSQLGVHSSALVTTLKASGAVVTTGTSDVTIVTPKALADAGIVGTAASTTAAGKIEIATAAETTTGTDATRAVSPDGLAGSDYGKRTVIAQVVAPGTDTSTGDGKAFFIVPSILNGYNLVEVSAAVYTAGTTNTTDVQIRNVTDSVDMLSTKITIDSTEVSTATAAAAAVIDTTKDDVATNDRIAIDVDAVSTTAAKGLVVALTFQLP